MPFWEKERKGGRIAALMFITQLLDGWRAREFPTAKANTLNCELHMQYYSDSRKEPPIVSTVF